MLRTIGRALCCDCPLHDKKPVAPSCSGGDVESLREEPLAHRIEYLEARKAHFQTSLGLETHPVTCIQTSKEREQTLLQDLDQLIRLRAARVDVIRKRLSAEHPGLSKGDEVRAHTFAVLEFLQPGIFTPEMCREMAVVEGALARDNPDFFSKTTLVASAYALVKILFKKTKTD